MAKYNVTIGDDFVIEAIDIEDVTAVEALAGVVERRARRKHEAVLAYAVLGFAGLGLLISMSIGLVDGSFDELGGTWAVASPWVGMVLGRYFKME